jgi:hypothetical protein
MQRVNRTTVLLALAAATAFGTWGIADTKPPKDTTPGSHLEGESAKDAALPKEFHELHVARRHLVIARDVLKQTKDGGEKNVEARTKINEAIDLIEKVGGFEKTIDKDKEPENKDKK